MCRYKHRCGLSHEQGKAAWLPHIKVFIPVHPHKKLMRFRLGCWPLAANRSNGFPKEERTCPVCQSEAVEDEEHVLLQCTAYESLRRSSGLDLSGSMRDVLLGPEQAKLAVMLGQIWTTRHACVPFLR